MGNDGVKDAVGRILGAIPDIKRMIDNEKVCLFSAYSLGNSEYSFFCVTDTDENGQVEDLIKAIELGLNELRFKHNEYKILNKSKEEEV